MTRTITVRTTNNANADRKNVDRRDCSLFNMPKSLSLKATLTDND